ncbi:EscU/YscU/HrcU family type III secretion system export apparatus switch protein [Brucella sp. IR073]|uniref:EscU/YscU/HrcU family type III secretion system export apparatus switch protein n=1 Tax=unclassified Brucella TaxID=2632610 RepID=UPI003B97DEEB
MSSDKTEQPTPYKLREQRREGQIPQRKYSLEAGSTIVSTIVLFIMLSSFSVFALTMAGVVWNSVSKPWIEALRTIIPPIEKLGLLCLMMISIMGLFSLVFGLLLNKFNFSVRALSPKFQKLNPASNAKELFSLEKLHSFLIIFVYFLYMVVCLYVTITENVKNIIMDSVCGTRCLVNIFLDMLKKDIGYFLLLCLCIGVADYFIQSRLFLRRNKMSKQEVKREYKTREGDPHIKSTRKSLAINDAMLPNPREATHVLCGPEHLVAVIYYAGRGVPPFVIGKAKGPSVTRMRSFYKELGKPTIFVPSVALEFFKMAESGNYLPPRGLRLMEKIVQTLS